MKNVKSRGEKRKGKVLRKNGKRQIPLFLMNNTK